MKILFVIPARAGSKGLPGKNVKILGDQPLVNYSINFAIQNLKKGDQLCISTNDLEVIDIAKKLNVDIPFKRPDELAKDNSTSQDVILHAISFFESKGFQFDAILLLQPTSPFRIQEDFESIIDAYSEDCEMVVSVKESKENPYFNLFEQNENGFLNKSKPGNYTRRQDCPPVYAYNGSMYLIRVDAIKSKLISDFTKIKKVIMPPQRSIDIDTFEDWKLAEFHLNNMK